MKGPDARVLGQIVGQVVAKVGPIDTTSAAVAASTARRPRALLQTSALPLLILSIAARFAWTYLAPHGANFVDLHVYVGGAATLTHPGTLYSYVYADQTPDFPLPFTYPPFAAVVLYPLHFVPFGVLAFLWQVAIVVALYGVVRVSQRLIGVSANRRAAMLWTAVTIWIEPLRSNFDYGQINVFLVLAVLWAVYTTRWWLSGTLVGSGCRRQVDPRGRGHLSAGRAPVVGGVVLAGGVPVHHRGVAVRRRRSGPLLLHRPAGRRAPGRPHRHLVQSVLARRDLPHSRLRRRLRAAGSGRDRRHGRVAVLAWRALDDSDVLGRLLVVELFGLLLSPISWTHHWVWLVPLMIWLIHGPLRERLGREGPWLGLAGARP